MKKIAYIMCFLCICMCSNAKQQNTINKMINDSMHSFLNWYFSIADNINYGEDRPILYVCTDYLPYDFGFSEFFSQKSVRLYELIRYRETERTKKRERVRHSLDYHRIKTKLFNNKNKTLESETSQKTTVYGVFMHGHIHL